MTPESAARAAAELLSAALNNHTQGGGGLSAVEWVAQLPADAWPEHDMAQIASAIAATHAAGRIVDAVSVFEEIQRAQADVHASRIAEIADLAVNSYVGDLEARAKGIEKAHARRQLRARAEALARCVYEVSDEDLQLLLEAFVSQGQVDRAVTLQPTDVRNAPPPEDPIFLGGAVRGTLALLIAESGRSKSFLAMALSASIASNSDLIAPFTAIQPGSVLYFSFEDPASIVKLRLGHIARAAGVAPEKIDAALDSQRLVFFCDLHEPLFEADKFGRVSKTAILGQIRRIIQQTNPVMVVLDPLSGVANVADENSNAQIGAVAAELAALARSTDAVLLLVHHTGKAAAGAPGSQHAARGASSLACRSRWIMQLTAPGSDGTDDSRIEARVVKDSYHVAHQPVMLERCEGGALRALDAKGSSESAIVDAVADWIKANPDRCVSAQSIRTRQGDGRDAYLAIVSLIPAATGSAIFNAIRNAVSSGLFEYALYKRPNRSDGKRLVLGARFHGREETQDDLDDLHTTCPF